MLAGEEADHPLDAEAASGEVEVAHERVVLDLPCPAGDPADGDDADEHAPDEDRGDREKGGEEPCAPSLSSSNTTAASVPTNVTIPENKLTSTSGTLADYNYAEDGVGNITQIHDAVVPTFNRDFGYDDLNRLTAANSGSSLWESGSFTYDAMGNMTARLLGASGASFAYSGATPKLSSVTDPDGSRSISYDTSGNESSVGSASYTYTPRNLLASGDWFTYTYDGRGVRTVTTAQTPPAEIVSLSFAPSTVTGPSTSTGTITLSAPAPAGGLTVYLWTDNDAIAKIPSRVIVPVGAANATFGVSLLEVQTDTAATIRAAAGASTTSATLTVRETPRQVTALSLNPTAVAAALPSTGKLDARSIGVVPL